MLCTIVINLSAVISLAYLPCYSTREKESSESILLVALPLSNASEVSASWERGEEILPAAFVALEQLNNDSQLDIGLKLVVADSGVITSNGYSYSGNLLEVIATLTLQNRFADVEGIVGVLHPNLLLTLKSFQLPIASLVHFGGIHYHHSVFYLTASTLVVTDSLAALNDMLSVNMGLITDTHHSYFSRLSSQLSKKAKVSLYIEIGHKSTKQLLSNIIVTEISKANVNIIFLGASKSISLKILCEAYKEGLTWPKYAWILLSFQLKLDDKNEISDKECNTHSILEGVLILELAQAEYRATYPSLGRNPYAYVLHDAIRTFGLAAARDNKSSSQLNTVYGPLLSDVSHSNVYIYQVLNSTLAPSGFYDGKLKSLTNVTIKSLRINPNELPALLPLPYLMILPVLCCIFNTVLLALFFCFRNEPDVKSTSISLTLMMFISCYLFAAFVIVLVVGTYLNLDLCMVGISIVSLCVPLILAILLVKMFRVYHIFTLHGYEKPSKFLYNSTLFVYTLLIIAPKVCVLILWSVIDMYKHEVADSSVVDKHCRSKHTIIWTMLLAIYDTVLSVSVITVAVKTRKIRFARYKDTKKVNMLIYVVLFIGISTWLYWYITTVSQRYTLVPTYIVYTGCISLPFVCQFTLFVPKIWTPLYTKFRDWMSDLYSLLKS